MKFLYYNIVIISALVFTCLPGKIYSEPAKKSAQLILNDSVKNFPILKDLFDSGFFSGINNMIVQYFHIEEKKDSTNDIGNFILTSSLEFKNGVEYISFKILKNDTPTRNVMILWDVPRKNEFMQKSSLEYMIGLSGMMPGRSIPDILAETPNLGKDIYGLNVAYNNDSGSVNSYDLSMHTGFSQTHRFFRTLGELGFMTSLGIAHYYINKDDNEEDWKYKYRWKDVGRRFGDGWTWDTNAFRTNTLYHIYSGSLYYQAARSNEYGPFASLAWTFTGSLIWEYIGEWREQTSANDMIFTTFGGVVLGEALRQSSICVERSLPNSIFGTIFACILDPWRIINRALDRAMGGDYKVSVVFINPAAQALIDKSRK